MNTIIEKLLNWLKDVMPTALWFFTLGHRLGLKKAQEVHNEMADLELKYEHELNEDKISNDGRSDDAVIDDAIKCSSPKVPKP